MITSEIESYTGLASVELIEEVKTHPNADKLDLVRVLNFWAIVPRGRYKVGDLCGYIYPDSVLPGDKEWATSYLPHTKRGRVRAVKLRGEWSEGIVLPVDVVSKERQQKTLISGDYLDWHVGYDATAVLGLVKYEPQMPQRLYQEAKGYLPYDIPKTDEDNWRKLRIDQFLGELVDVTLKIDGQSFTAYSVDDGHDISHGICSRSLDLKLKDVLKYEDDKSQPTNWHKIEAKYLVLQKLAGYCGTHDVNLALRGEIYGPGVQSFDHNIHSKNKELDVAFFSVWNIDEKRYEGPDSPHYYQKVCKALDLPVVPCLEIQVPLTYELLERYDSQLDTISGHPFEGVVIKGNSFHMKVINKFYDSKK